MSRREWPGWSSGKNRIDSLGFDPGWMLFDAHYNKFVCAQNNGKSGIRSQLLSLGGCEVSALRYPHGVGRAFFYYLNTRLLD